MREALAIHRRAPGAPRERGLRPQQPRVRCSAGPGSSPKRKPPTATRWRSRARSSGRRTRSWPGRSTTSRWCSGTGATWRAPSPSPGRRSAMSRKLYGEEHPDVALQLSNLASLLGARGDDDEAIAMARQALAMRRKLFGPDHEQVAMSLGNLGEPLEKKGDLAAARSLYEEALRIQRKVFGNEHPRCAVTLTHLAELALAEGDVGRPSPSRARPWRSAGRRWAGPCRFRHLPGDAGFDPPGRPRGRGGRGPSAPGPCHPDGRRCPPATGGSRRPRAGSAPASRSAGRRLKSSPSGGRVRGPAARARSAERQDRGGSRAAGRVLRGPGQHRSGGRLPRQDSSMRA